MIFKAEIDLDDLAVGDGWGLCVQDVIKEELLRQVKVMVRQKVVTDEPLQAIIAQAQDKVVLEIQKHLEGLE